MSEPTSQQTRGWYTKDDTEQTSQYLATLPGQFHFAGGGPAGARCAGCASFKRLTAPPGKASLRQAAAAGLPPPRPLPLPDGHCQRVKNGHGQAFLAAAFACKYFDPASTQLQGDVP
jgi:hypothetical protein